MTTAAEPAADHVLPRLLALVLLLWLFLFGVSAISAAFKGFGADFASSLVHSVSNPVLGLMMGILVTSLVQSSSTTTSLIVGLVGSGALDVPHAVPMILGANIGTTITNTLVSLGSITRGPEFARTFSAAVLHDIFNLMSVAMLLPAELLFGVISKPAIWLAGLFYGTTVEKPHSLFHAHFKAAVGAVADYLGAVVPSYPNVALLLLATVVLFTSLALIVRTLQGVILAKTEVFFDRFVGRSAVIAMVFGAVITASVQSSSITTSLLVPLAGAGVITLEQLFPITLGCNIGTTITALLASLSTDRVDGLAIALCHLLFNLFGIVVIFYTPPLRRLALRAARALGQFASVRKGLAIAWVLGVFFAVPGLVLAVQKLLGD